MRRRATIERQDKSNRLFDVRLFVRPPSGEANVRSADVLCGGPRGRTFKETWFIEPSSLPDGNSVYTHMYIPTTRFRFSPYDHDENVTLAPPRDRVRPHFQTADVCIKYSLALDAMDSRTRNVFIGDPVEPDVGPNGRPTCRERIMKAG